ncbi:MAG: DNA replication and repair protein RecF [Muribaculaceae bacterium]|nr:DNA replication and repair protein RecF [Muribaculaceae bacterium]
MTLREITIANFKNIRDARLEFSPKINGLLGHNGMGKSNLLDAIYYLSYCRSYAGIPDAQLITRGEGFTTIRGDYTRRGVEENVAIGMMPGQRKSVKRKGKEYQRLSQHFGVFPLVLVSPADQVIISGGAEERRRFMDMMIAQNDPVYLDRLLRYTNALEQRNKLLRDRVVDHHLYEAVEMTLVLSADEIYRGRKEWIERLQAVFDEYYHLIAGDDEPVKLSYAPPELPLQLLLDQARRHDEMVGHTSVGPHRDDLTMTVGDLPARRMASQGQCKTFTIALRLAQYDFLSRTAGMKPLLLLDDIFDKLDALRVERIISLATRPNMGQIFITDTNRDHLDQIMRRVGGDYRLWEVDSGHFTPITTSNDEAQ